MSQGYVARLKPLQERPYTSRPSRTQQLANPKLLPPLSSDLPKQPSPTGNLNGDRGPSDRHKSRSRSRSVASNISSSSVSTISTNRSQSPAPRRRADLSPSPFRPEERKRKARRSLSIESYPSSGSDAESHSRARGTDRHLRRKWNSRSPDERGRQHASDRRGSWRNRSRSRSRNRSKIARERRSMTPALYQNATPSRYSHSPGRRYRRSSQDSSPERSRLRQRERSASREKPRDRPAAAHTAPPPKRRSLSPYSHEQNMRRSFQGDQVPRLFHSWHFAFFSRCPHRLHKRVFGAEGSFSLPYQG
ncbi:predicted protein [Uncinocarpus reesii 1704]|uniref:Uncharacterized protein n=1 Tax=Uncinocarpus reesii (strain UAMH 1704) TaxID=336963 RepID=C4JTI2_UNCRE|nr:uncharacterized protein UREG_05771 [Uncinocarpus reesii 1704]EEP80929.1 predicted protein [Uncinocarpus reesii 1704]